jgi:hypothetical protein
MLVGCRARRAVACDERAAIVITEKMWPVVRSVKRFGVLVSAILVGTIGLRVAALAVALGLGAGCTRAIPTPDYRPVTTMPPRTTWIGPITLIADDQKFHIGNQAFVFRSGFIDRTFSNSAVRVPQQDLFGDSLLGLAAMGRGIAVHLGDAMDLSCADEWRDFSRIMNASGRDAWFWTPGNHDGFFFGNFVGPLDQWRAACHPSQPITKAAALKTYLLDHLAGYTATQLDPVSGSWSCPRDQRCHGLRRAAWQIGNGNDYYRAYLIQEIDVPRQADAPAASLILIDTSTYARSPRIAASESNFRYAAGEQGCIGPDQLAVLDQWTAHAAGEGRTVLIAGHHAFNDLDDDTQRAIDGLIVKRRIATYISAHTHWGQYFTHTASDGYAWLEPNLGSVIDYDSEFGTLSLGFHEGKTYVRMARTSTSSFTTGARADLGIECKDEWLARPTDDDYYIRYMQTTSADPRPVETLYYATMLAALGRYYRCVPTIPAHQAMPEQCIPSQVACSESSEVQPAVAAALATRSLDKIRAKALELLALDDGRNVEPCLRRQYRVCQSLWAAEYEKREFITPVRGEDVFQIHTARSAR